MSRRKHSISNSELSSPTHCEACVVEQESRAAKLRPTFSTMPNLPAAVRALGGGKAWVNPDCEDCVAEYVFMQASPMRESSAAPQPPNFHASFAVPMMMASLATQPQTPAARLTASTTEVGARQSLPTMHGGVAWGADCVDAAAFNSVNKQVHPLHLAAREQAGPAWQAGPGKIPVVDALTGRPLRPIALSYPAPEVLMPLTIYNPETSAPMGLLLPDGTLSLLGQPRSMPPAHGAPAEACPVVRSATLASTSRMPPGARRHMQRPPAGSVGGFGDEACRMDVYLQTLSPNGGYA